MFAPLATIIHGARIDFQIEGSGKNYININISMLELIVKLTAETGGDIAPGTKVGTGNLPLHNISQSVTMKFADTVVCESKKLYHTGLSWLPCSIMKRS